MDEDKNGTKISPLRTQKTRKINDTKSKIGIKSKDLYLKVGGLSE